MHIAYKCEEKYTRKKLAKKVSASNQFLLSRRWDFIFAPSESIECQQIQHKKRSKINEEKKKEKHQTENVYGLFLLNENEALRIRLTNIQFSSFSESVDQFLWTKKDVNALCL